MPKGKPEPPPPPPPAPEPEIAEPETEIKEDPRPGYYEGDYAISKRHGYGVYTFYAGARYSGEYKQGKKHGQGTFIYPDGSRYEGSWRENERNGHGTFYYANGDVYTGFWRDNKRHGYGEYRKYSNDAVHLGSWKGGVPSGPMTVLLNKWRYEAELQNTKVMGIMKFFLGEYEVKGQYKEFQGMKWWFTGPIKHVDKPIDNKRVQLKYDADSLVENVFFLVDEDYERYQDAANTGRAVYEDLISSIRKTFDIEPLVEEVVTEIVKIDAQRISEEAKNPPEEIVEEKTESKAPK